MDVARTTASTLLGGEDEEDGAGDLLPGFHITDASEFERWLDGERQRLPACGSNGVGSGRGA